jgi:hypothetical protein
MGETIFPRGSGPFVPLGVEIRGSTPTGRATVRVLGLNDEMRQMVRYELRLEGLYAAKLKA